MRCESMYKIKVVKINISCLYRLFVVIRFFFSLENVSYKKKMNIVKTTYFGYKISPSNFVEAQELLSLLENLCTTENSQELFNL